MEEWVVIPRFGGKYQINKNGTIRNFETGYVFKCTPDSHDGYVRVYINGATYKVHRLMCESFLPLEDSSNLEVDHINGEVSDNRIENLELWSTSQPNGQGVGDKINWAISFLK